MLPNAFTLRSVMGTKISGEISLISSSIPANAFKALRRTAEVDPKRSVVFPVTILPLGNSIAAAGFIVGQIPGIYDMKSMLSSERTTDAVITAE